MTAVLQDSTEVWRGCSVPGEAWEDGTVAWRGWTVAWRGCSVAWRVCSVPREAGTVAWEGDAVGRGVGGAAVGL